MGRLRNNEKGFGAVEGLLIVIVALVCVVGWFVYKNHNTADYATTAKTTSPAKTTTTTRTVDPYAGWKTFKSNFGNISLKYPADWSMTDMTANSNEDQAFSLQSPDKNYGSFLLYFDILSKTQEGQLGQYP